LLRDVKLDVNKLPEIVKDVIWSASVQHDRAASFISDAIKSLGKINYTSFKYNHNLINAIYDKRAQYVSNLERLPAETKKTLIENRYRDERQRALKILRQDHLITKEKL
jgi:hypothetical protein